MKCAWKQFLNLLPPTLRPQVDELGRERLQELRLRLQCRPLLVCGDGQYTLPVTVTQDMLGYVVNVACRYSPWTAESAAMGYVTAPGGHRIGLCGRMVMKDGGPVTFGALRSLNIRVARDFPGIAAPLATLSGNVLLLGPPGSGKTTLLRDLIRQRSDRECVSVADERGELFPEGLEAPAGADILMGCKKPEKEFFDKCFDAIGHVDKSRCIILGDSLTSDMQGGRNAGIATCYLGSNPDDRCDYAISELLEFLKILS